MNTKTVIKTLVSKLKVSHCLGVLYFCYGSLNNSTRFQFKLLFLHRKMLCPFNREVQSLYSVHQMQVPDWDQAQVHVWDHDQKVWDQDWHLKVWYRGWFKLKSFVIKQGLPSSKKSDQGQWNFLNNFVLPALNYGLSRESFINHSFFSVNDFNTKDKLMNYP